MDTLIQDARYALRMLLRRPAFALVAIAAVAIGIGANAAIVGVVKTALAERLPFRQVERLVMIWQQDLPNDRDRITLTMAEYEAYREAGTLSDVAAARPTAFTATIGRTSSALQGARVSVNLLSTLGAAPAFGRDFRPDEGEPGRHLVALLSHGIWLREFGGDPAVVGRAMVLDEAAGAASAPTSASRAAYTVVGVLPPGFEIFYTQADVVIPLAAVSGAESRAARGLRLVARLAESATLARASEQLRAIDRRIAESEPQPNRGSNVALIPLRDEEVGDIRPTMVALGIGAGLVLLVVCANLSNMLLARVTERNREIAMRTALGASSARLVRQLVTETLVLVALGAGIGVLLAGWAVSALATHAPAEMLRLTSVRMDWSVIGVSILLAMAAALFCSAGPAWRAARRTAIPAAIARSTAPPEGQRLRRILLASQVALAFVAVTGAVLMALSFVRLRDAAVGFDPRDVLTFRLAPPVSRYGAPPTRSALYRGVLARLDALPGVDAAGAIHILPITDADQSMPITAPGSAASDPARPMIVKFRAASPGFFRALGIPVLRGREFRETDIDAGVAVLSRSLARSLWGEGEILNRQVTVHVGPNLSRTFTVAGVVGDVRQFRDAPPQPTLYASSLGQAAMTFALRSAMPPEALGESVGGALREVDAELAAYDVLGMTDRLDRAGPFTTGRFRAAIGVAFGATCLLLAVFGVHGLVRYAVTQQTCEIGIRMAIGATGTAIVRSIVLSHLVPVSLGAAIGAGAAVATSRALEGYLYDVSSAGPRLLLLVTAILVTSGIAAAWLPAKRAARLSPLEALRAE